MRSIAKLSRIKPRQILIDSQNFQRQGMEQLSHKAPKKSLDGIFDVNGQTVVYFSNPWLPIVSFDDQFVNLAFANFNADVVFQFQDAFECLSSFKAKMNKDIILGFILGLAESFQTVVASITAYNRMINKRDSNLDCQNAHFTSFGEDYVDFDRLDKLNSLLASHFVYLPKLPYMVQTVYGVSKPRPPIWLHRQAGRYLPEYMKAKGTKNFLDITADPKLSSDITLQPVWRYSVDAAIIFSDIMTIPQALNMELEMRPGPFFPHPIKTQEDVEKLIYDKTKFDHVLEALRLTKIGLVEHDKKTYNKLHTALIGFCGAPWTVMSYMVGRDIAAQFVKDNPELTHKILGKITDASVDYLSHQVRAGADMVQVFDSFVGELPKDLYIEFEKPYLLEISSKFSQLHPTTPIQIFPRNLEPELIYELCKSDYWTISVSQSFSKEDIKQFPLSTCIQGNFDPDFLYLEDSVIESKARDMVTQFKHSLPVTRSRYIVNLGHGTKPDMDCLKVKVLINEVKSLYLGTRASSLALAQANIVANSFAKSPFLIKLKKFTTKGDRVLDRSLSDIGDKGLFTRELEDAILNNSLDFAQHSLKDLETKLQPGLCIGAITKRHSKYDCLVVSIDSSWSDLNELPSGSIIGTSALRRTAYLKHKYPGLVVKDVRGTVGTRLSKMLVDNKYDGLILAESGLRRLIEFDNGVQLLPKFKIIPLVNEYYAAGQGAIALECSDINFSLKYYLKDIVEDSRDALEVLAEREILSGIEGGCQVPFGIKSEETTICNADLKERQMLKLFCPSNSQFSGVKLSAFVSSVDGSQFSKVENKSVEDLISSLLDNDGLSKVKEARTNK